MLIDTTRDNLYLSLCSRGLRADKTSYIGIVEECAAAGHSFVSLTAPRGLGVSTFADMLGAFYGPGADPALFPGASGPEKDRLGSCAVLGYDFAEVNAATPYNGLVAQLAAETAAAVAVLYPEVRKLPRYDFAAQLQAVAAGTGRELVLILKNFDRIPRFVTRRAEFLNAWRRLWAGIAEANRRKKFIHLAVAGTHIPGIMDMMINPARPGEGSLFYNLAPGTGPAASRMFGWCGITYEEMTAILKAGSSGLDSDELYDWCGHYDGGLVRPGTLFTSIESKDLFITSGAGNAVWFIRETLGAGNGSYLLCGDLGVARLLNGETVSMRELSRYDPRARSPHAGEIYAFTRRFLQILYSEGLISLVRQTGDPRLDVAELVNTEVMLAVTEEVSANDDYLKALCDLAAEREKIQLSFENGDGFVLGEILKRYLELQRKHLGDRSNTTVWEAVRDLIADLENYVVVPYENMFIVKDAGASASCRLIALAVNADEAAFLDRTLNLRLRSEAFRRAIGDYRGRVSVFVYNFILGDGEPQVSVKTALLA